MDDNNSDKNVLPPEQTGMPSNNDELLVEQEPQTVPETAPTEGLVTENAAATEIGEVRVDDVRPSTPASDNMQPVTPVVQPPKKSKKGLIIGIIAAVLVLLIGGGAAAYVVYQNPERVLLDGIINTAKTKEGATKLTVAYEQEGAKVTFALEGKTNGERATGTMSAEFKGEYLGIDLDLSGSVDFAGEMKQDAGEAYVKFNDVQKLVDQVLDTVVDAYVENYESYGYTVTDSDKKEIRDSFAAEITPIVDKVNNRWIKFTRDSEEELDEDQQCLVDAYTLLQEDKAVRDELMKAYQDNRFVIIKEELGVKDGSYGYVVDFDKAKVEAFSDATENSTFATAVKKCSDDDTSNNTTDDEDEEVPFKDTRVEVWVSQWSHKLTGVKVTTSYEPTTATSSEDMKADIMVELQFDYTPVGDIELPSDAVDFKDLQEELSGSEGGSNIINPLT